MSATFGRPGFSAGIGGAAGASLLAESIFSIDFTLAASMPALYPLFSFITI
jgi:hypothetical protein